VPLFVFKKAYKVLKTLIGLNIKKSLVFHWNTTTTIRLTIGTHKTTQRC